jgi:prepilin-type N-terminal cleavage/methylation domain-containing protein
MVDYTSSFKDKKILENYEKNRRPNFLKKTRELMDLEGSRCSAFSLIELSIVLIIMGLLVAGVTGGASMIENAKITSFKREIDDLIRDTFTFYSRTGRLPGDLDNSGQIGWEANRNPYPIGSFSTPYDTINNINKVSAPFIELYLYGISSFKPDPSKSGITASTDHGMANIKNIVLNGGVPISKVYKNYYTFMHRTEIVTSSDSNNTFFNIKLGAKSINVFNYNEYVNKKSVDIPKKIDLKFDDGVHSSGNIRAGCGAYVTTYSSSTSCYEFYFYFGIE